MKNTILFVFVLCSYAIYGQNNLVGIWDTGENNTKIEIAAPDGVITGKIKSSDNPKAAVGKVILKDLKKEDTHWKGKIYAAKKKKWYDAVLSEKKEQLEINISVGFLSKTLTWKKLQ